MTLHNKRFPEFIVSNCLDHALCLVSCSQISSDKFWNTVILCLGRIICDNHHECRTEGDQSTICQIVCSPSGNDSADNTWCCHSTDWLTSIWNERQNWCFAPQPCDKLISKVDKPQSIWVWFEEITNNQINLHNFSCKEIGPGMFTNLVCIAIWCDKVRKLLLE